MSPMLKSKCILAPREESDGIRISIMSRHTLDDGQTADERLPGRYDEHIKEFAVPAKVIGAYKRNEITFDELSAAYLSYIFTQKEKVIALIQRAIDQNLTVLCIEDEEHKHVCHRSLFIRYAKELADALLMPLKIKNE